MVMIAKSCEPRWRGRLAWCGRARLSVLVLVAPVVSVALVALGGIGLSDAAFATTMALPGGNLVAMPVLSVREARYQTTARQQFDFSCGSAALATLLSHHYGTPVSEREVFEAMYQRGDQAKIRAEGFSLLDMKRYLEGRGFAADGFVQPLAQLAGAGLPAIVLIRENGYRHFVVIKGLRDGRVLLGDPSAGLRVVTRAHFEEVWVHRLLFVIHNRRGTARFNAAEDWRLAPRAPLHAGLINDGLMRAVVPKHGPGDF